MLKTPIGKVYLCFLSDTSELVDMSQSFGELGQSTYRCSAQRSHDPYVTVNAVWYKFEDVNSPKMSTISRIDIHEQM